MIRARWAYEGEEASFQAHEGYKVAGIILEDIDDLREPQRLPIGRGSLLWSPQGQVFAHGFTVECPQANAAAVLYSFAREAVKCRGLGEIFMHFEPDTPRKVKEFWMRLGALPVLEVWRLEL